MKLTQGAAGWRQSYEKATVSLRSDPGQDSTQFDARIHENEIPAFVEAELERLYGSIYSCLKQFRIYDGVVAGVHTYVARDIHGIQDILLFRVTGGRVKVLNEVIQLEGAEVERFAKLVFAHFKQAQLISFKAIQNNIERLPFAHQRHNCLEDIVLALPASAQAYHASLGKNTRRNIKRYGERLRTTFPSFTFTVYEKGEASDADLRAIVALNHARMEGKNKQSDIDYGEEDRLIALTRQCGLVGICRIDGKVCAGAMSFRAGDNYFLNVLAHDPAYDDYWLGILCCYMTICECIERGGKEFHFLWGRYDYKFTLLAVARDLERLVIYRSRGKMWSNPDVWLKTAMEDWSRRANQRLHEAKRGNSAGSRLAMRLLEAYRSARRIGDVLTTRTSSR
jgi:hypothetical protein